MGRPPVIAVIASFSAEESRGVSTDTQVCADTTVTKLLSGWYRKDEMNVPGDAVRGVNLLYRESNTMSSSSTSVDVPLVEMKNIFKKFPGVIALDGVSFNLYRGEVHALVGENGSGKSTLIKILSGVYEADQGEIFVYGKKETWSSPVGAQERGISTIHQEINLIPYLDVASNMYLNREPLARGKLVIDFREMYRRASEVLHSIGIEIDARRIVSELSVAEKQLVEIAKAMVQNMRVLILDEPTAALPASDAENLFKIIDMLKKRGVGIIYVSHRLEELELLADRVTVIRDGHIIDTRLMSDVTIDEIIRLMVGRDIKETERSNTRATSEEVLRVESLCKWGLFTDINFRLRRGEILGIAGLVGSGRSDLVAVLGGASPPDKGIIVINGSEARITSPASALENGLGYVPSERKTEGIATLLSVRDNIAMASWRFLSKLFGILLKAKTTTLVQNFVDKLSIKTAGLEQKAGNLSGGNQQKLVLAKVLARGSKILLFDEPTRGIDVGSRREIYRLMNELVANGKSVILSSSDLPELLSNCNRILAMYSGRIVAEFEYGVSKEELLRAVFGQTKMKQEGRAVGINERATSQNEEISLGKESESSFRLSRIFGITTLVVITLIFLGMTAPGFTSWTNLVNLFRQVTILLLLASAQTFALITRGIDLSVGSIMAIVSMTVGIVGLGINNLVLGILAGLIVAVLIGVFNGAIAGGLNVEPFIVTLGSMFIVRGVTLLVNDGQPVFGFPSWFSFIADGQVGPVPFLPIVGVIIGLTCHVTLSRTRFGRHLLAIGGNEDGARVTGVNVAERKWLGYMASAFMAGIAGIVISSRLFSSQPTIGNGAYIEGMAAAVLGGVSIEGGQGNIIGVIQGVLFIGLLSNGLNLLNVPTYTQSIIMGGLLIILLIVDRLRQIAKEK